MPQCADKEYVIWYDYDTKEEELNYVFGGRQRKEVSSQPGQKEMGSEQIETPSRPGKYRLRFVVRGENRGYTAYAEVVIAVLDNGRR